ncbi:LuxR C-terminal-related transcriptional regulator [Oceanobacillus saliphilus]|uniref:LuxR C-terminal-related transcriptional regulator n=1 Tax=Oceanobacillus saliphilus TaxID=2925834 RepID=UPI00201E33EC|nr:LuxR C-terminal-related transcriptional regulator [Oceanobacillus saliphilus]
MNENLELLEELQSAYAAKYGFTIWLTDENGETVLPPDGDNELCNVLLNLEQNNIGTKLKPRTQKAWSAHTPVFYDIFPGIYVLTTSISLENTKKYDLFAGFMIEDETQDLLIEQLNATYPDEDIQWGTILVNTPHITPSAKTVWKDWMKKVGKLITQILTETTDSSIFSLQNELFRRGVQERDRSIAHLLHDFFQHKQGIDFLGLAEEQDNSLVVTEVIGEGIDAFQGAPFSPGEGFLGRVFLTGEFAFWENIDKDPRSIFFKRHQFKPKSLLCYPMKQYDGSTKLLFGGNIHKGGFSSSDLEMAKTLGIMLEAHSIIHHLQRENDEQLRRLSSLIEISKLMVAAPDIKRIVYILVDIGLNLVDGTFSCLVLRDIQHDKVKLISRGKATIDIGAYAKDAAARFFDGDSREKQSSTIQVTEDGDRVVECPLFNRGKTVGILSVGISNQSEAQLQEHIHYLETLSIIGGVSLQLAGNEEEQSEEKQVNALFRAIEQFDKEAYAKAVNAANLAGKYAMHLGLDAPVIKEIIHACQLASYTPEFIRDTFPEKRIDLIIKEGKALMEGNTLQWEEASIGGQVVALVMNYIQTESIEAIPKQILGNETVQTFISFVMEFRVVEEEINLDELPTERKIDSVTSTIKEMDLSPREQEVLDLVIQGLNNKEIAQELYISGHTVKNHVTKIFQKLDVPDRAHAISKVYQLKYHSS